MVNPRWHEKAQYLNGLNASWLLWGLAAIALRGPDEMLILRKELQFYSTLVHKIWTG